MIALPSISLQAAMLRMGHTQDYIQLSWIKYYKISIKVRIFVWHAFSALLLMANQCGKRTSKVSSMLQKTAHVEYGTKTSQNQNNGHFTRLIFLLPGPCLSVVLLKNLLFSCVNNAALEAFNFEKLNFSKTTVAYETF